MENGEYKIERDVKIPKSVRGGRGAPSKYPFHQMKVGDSFFVKAKPAELRLVIRRITGAASGHSLRHKTKFTLRTLEDGIRVWRVE